MRRAAAALLATTALTGVAACSSAPAHTGAASPAHPQAPSATSRASTPSAAARARAPRDMLRVRPRVSVAQASWRLPERVSRGVAVPVPGGAVLAGGLLSGDVSTDRAYRITLPAGQVRRIAPLTTAAHDAAGAILRGEPAVFGGGSSSELSVVQRLGGDGAWHAVGRLPGARSDLAAVSYGGDVVVIGGYDGSSSPRTILRTSDGRRTTTIGHLPTGLRYAAVAVSGHTAWVIGGEESGQELRGVYAVDLRTGVVRTAGRLPHGLGHASAVVVGDRILVLGGRTTPDRPTSATWWFTPSTGAWRRAGPLPYPVADAPTVVLANRAYLLGGETPDFTDRVTVVSWR